MMMNFYLSISAKKMAKTAKQPHPNKMYPETFVLVFVPSACNMTASSWPANFASSISNDVFLT